jgi:hypothetical protein
MRSERAQAATGPSEVVVRQLFARSGNRCAFPRCGTEIVQGGTTIGQVCHIKSPKPGGPRFDPKQSAAERHGYDNLILLCANHHKVVDDDEEAYTVDRLIKMRSDHERRTTGTLGDELVERAARLLIDQSVASQNQSGGIMAHTINVHHVHLAPAVPPAPAPSIIPSLLQWHENRTQQVWTRATPVKLLDEGEALVMHVLPLSALDGRPTPAFEAISLSPRLFPPIKGEGFFQSTITIDGLLNEADGQGLGGKRRAYTHVLQTGAVEAVGSSLAIKKKFLELPFLQKLTIKYALAYTSALVRVGIDPPIAVLVDLLRVQGMRLLQDFIGTSFPEDLPCGELSLAWYKFAEVIFDRAPASFQEAAQLLRPGILRRLANVAGLPAAPYFDADGNCLLNVT